MIAALVIALTCFVTYAVLAGWAPDLADQLGGVYAVFIVAAWFVLVRRAGRR